jgi:DNA polymerase
MGKFLPNVKITGVHGKKFEVSYKGRDLVVVPMYHPAAGLRSTQVKDQTIDDFRKLPGILDEIRQKKEDKKTEVEQMNLI